MDGWSHVDLIKDKVYDAKLEESKVYKRPPMYRIVDESGEDYLYPTWLFEIIEN